MKTYKIRKHNYLFTFVWILGVVLLLLGKCSAQPCNLVTDFTPIPASICGPPLVVTCTPKVSGGKIPYTYRWDFKGGKPVSSTLQFPPKILYDKSGSFLITLTVTDSTGKCINIIRKNVQVGNHIADFNITNRISCYGEIVALEEVSTPANKVTKLDWQYTPDLSISSENGDTYAQPLGPGKYPICLTTYFQLGCTSTKCDTIIVLSNTDERCKPKDTIIIHLDTTTKSTWCNAEVDIPNAFSPNNDGINDNLEIFSKGIDSETSFLKLYNRWGKCEAVFFNITEHKIYHINYNLAVGTYVYYFRAKCISGGLITKKGNITVIR